MDHVKRVINSLSKKETYPGEVNKIDLIHTAVSYVFLTGKYAYKLNKPLNLGFLDYTTLEKRKEILDKELKLNKVLCPELYEEVLPITEKNGEMEFNGDGEVIEYALRMKEFSQNEILTNKLKEDNVSKEDISRISKAISDFHKNNSTSDEIKQFGTFSAIEELWKENFDQTLDFKDKTISEDQFNFIKEKIESFLEKNETKFNKRVEDGRIKHNHGDFHSGNICLGDDIHIFDRIVFNMKFPCSDTAAEVAFLAMDLDFYNKEELSKHFVDEYMKESQDYDMKDLLDFYKCYRAYIRGKIACFKLKDPNISEEERNDSIKEAKNYFGLSSKYAILL